MFRLGRATVVRQAAELLLNSRENLVAELLLDTHSRTLTVDVSGFN